MENASKALLIAGGILLAILTLSVLILTVTKISDFNKSKEESLETEQILKFNSEYEAYNKKSLLGTEVITVWNKAIDNNSKKDSNARTYPVTVEITFSVDEIASLEKETTASRLALSNKTSSRSKLSSGMTINQVRATKNISTANGNMEEEDFETIKKQTFFCHAIEYDETGRLIRIVFSNGIDNPTPTLIIMPNPKEAESNIRDIDM